MNALFSKVSNLRARAPRILIAIGLVATMAFVARASASQPHTDPHHPPNPQPTTGEFAHDPPDPHGHDKLHPEGGHAPAHHGPDPINWTDLSDKHRPAFIGLLINFGILIALYYTLGKKPVAEGLKQRRVNIGKAIDEARKLYEEAKERAKKYQGDLKNVDVDAETAKTTLISSGKGEIERLLAETEERAERMKRDAERLVEQERKQLQQDLLLETIGTSVEQAQKILEKSATPEDHARLANELLAELAKKPGIARSAVRTGGAA